MSVLTVRYPGGPPFCIAVRLPRLNRAPWTPDEICFHPVWDASAARVARPGVARTDALAAQREPLAGSLRFGNLSEFQTDSDRPGRA